ncbi:hypothetical protein, partial [Prevotellamassilia timonensis]|uniref:hypothetical protein n=1 Tax=Prevotellamassilia timonensis TaxID=1852370 RepID=UPI004025C7DB
FFCLCFILVIYYCFRLEGLMLNMQLLLAVVALVFNSYLHPDAGRVAPIRASVWWQRLLLTSSAAAQQFKQA